jgi:NADP-dependent 3-hydroxy acid dehydrogenase YdfG
MSAARPPSSGWNQVWPNLPFVPCLDGRLTDGGEAFIRTTIVCPGAVKTELLEHITEADIQQAKEYVGAVGISPDTFANLVAFAISQPEDVDINEIIFRPTSQEL